MRRTLKSLIIVVVGLTLVVSVVSAHGKQVAGRYTIAFGWQNEPAYAGLDNGPEVVLGLADDENAPFPLEVEVNLRAEVSFGPASKTVFLEWVRGEAGHYTARLIPSLPGDYVFRIRGTIGDTPVDVTFDSADGEFSSVEPASDIIFPAPDITAAATIAELEARLTVLETRIAALEAGE